MLPPLPRRPAELPAPQNPSIGEMTHHRVLPSEFSGGSMRCWLTKADVKFQKPFEWGQQRCPRTRPACRLALPARWLADCPDRVGQRWWQLARCEGTAANAFDERRHLLQRG